MLVCNSGVHTEDGADPNTWSYFFTLQLVPFVGQINQEGNLKKISSGTEDLYSVSTYLAEYNVNVYTSPG